MFNVKYTYNAYIKIDLALTPLGIIISALYVYDTPYNQAQSSSSSA